MQTNRSMPQGTIIPELGYTDVGAAADWLCNSFGFTVRLWIGDHRAQLDIGDGSIVVTQLPPDRAADSSDHGIMVRVEDVARHHDHAKAQGVRIVSPPEDHPYGERQYSVIDLGGHRWIFSQSIADIDPGDWGGVPG